MTSPADAERGAFGHTGEDCGCETGWDQHTASWDFGSLMSSEEMHQHSAGFEAGWHARDVELASLHQREAALEEVLAEQNTQVARLRGEIDALRRQERVLTGAHEDHIRDGWCRLCDPAMHTRAALAQTAQPESGGEDAPAP